MLKLNKISVSFTENKQNTFVLNDVNLNILEGKFTSLIGKSGCGKTTLLRVIAKLQKPTSGKVSSINHSNKIKVGWVPQQVVLLPNSTVLKNILLPAVITRYKYDEDYLNHLLIKYGLDKYIDFYPNQLSGGQKQIVSIIRALIMNPNLLLLDEPFASLDSYTREKIDIELADKIRSEKITTVMVTHSIEEAVFMSDKIILMKPNLPSRIKQIFDISFSGKRDLDLKNTKQYTEWINLLRNKLLDSIEINDEI